MLERLTARRGAESHDASAAPATVFEAQPRQTRSSAITGDREQHAIAVAVVVRHERHSAHVLARVRSLTRFWILGDFADLRRGAVDMACTMWLREEAADSKSCATRAGHVWVCSPIVTLPAWPRR